MMNWSKEFRTLKTKIDTQLAMSVLSHIGNTSEYRKGYRLAATEGERITVEYIRSILEEIGIDNISKHRVPVYKWIQLNGKIIDLDRNISYNLISYPGCPGGYVEGELIYVENGFKEFYEKRDVKNKIVLIDIDYNIFPSHIIPAKEAFNHGASAVIFTHLKDSGMSYFYKDTYYTCNGECFDELGIMGYIPAYNAYKLIHRTGKRFKLEIEVEDGKGFGYNLTAEIPGKEDFQIIIGAHHDAYFKGIIDNASGVSLLITLAKLIKDIEYDNRFTIKLIFFTGEEYGAKNTIYDYLRGSYNYFRKMKESERNKTIVFTNVDGIGYYESPIGIITTPDYYELYKPLLSGIAPYLKTGLNIMLRPGLWYDMWTGIYHGIGSINICNIGGYDYYEKYYHTQRDDINIFSTDRFKEYIALTYCIIRYTDNLTAPIPRFSALVNDYLTGLDIRKMMETSEKTRIIIDKVRVYSSRLDDAVNQINKHGTYITTEKLRESIIMANRIRKIMYTFIYKMGEEYPTDKTATYNYEYLQKLLVELSIIIYNLKKRDYSRANEKIKNLNILKWAKYISHETYKWILKKIKKGEYWGRNRLPNYIDLYPLLTSIDKPNILYKKAVEKRRNIEVEERRLFLRILEMLEELSEYFKGLYTWMLDIDNELYDI